MEEWDTKQGVGTETTGGLCVHWCGEGADSSLYGSFIEIIWCDSRPFDTVRCHSYSGRHVTCRPCGGCSWKAYNQNHAYSYTYTCSPKYFHFIRPWSKCTSQPCRVGQGQNEMQHRNAKHCQAPGQGSHVGVRHGRWSGYTLMCCCMYSKLDIGLTFTGAPALVSNLFVPLGTIV